MNDHNSTNDNPHDWHDALLDRGLAELLGGETPPDLSEKILAAAKAETQAPTVTLADNLPPRPISQHKHWATFAAAACLLVAVGAILFTGNVNGLRRAIKSVARVEEPQSTNNRKQLAESDGPTSAGTPIQGDQLHTLDGPLTTAREQERVHQKEQSRALQTMSKPRIIPQDGEDERLGIATEESGKFASRFKSAPESNRTEIEAELRRRAASAPPEIIEQQRRQRDRERNRSQSTVGKEPLSKEKLAESVDRFSRLRDEQKYSEMERVANELYAAAPTDPVAQQVWENAKYIRRKMLDRELGDLAEAGVKGVSNGSSTLNSSAPSDNNAKTWKNLSTRRKKYAAGDLTDRSLEDSWGVEAEPYSFGLEFVPAQPSRDQYTPIHENPFIEAIGPDAVSTFSIDVDTASYANVRQFLEQSRQLPPPNAVRIEELVNYFPYDYAPPTDDVPFATHMEVAACPWNTEHRLARIAIKGKEIDRTRRPQSNLVFLIDVSGSMNDPAKLPLLVDGMKLLTHELGENDRVAIVVYASSEGLALESTRGDEQDTILAALNRLQAGGSTAGGAGINLAYQIATDNFITGGTNRVILCTDGDFNVGISDTNALTQLAEQKAKTGVFLTVLGFGRGNLNDAMMESISGRGNGNYHYVDNLTEARKVLVEEMTGTLITIAKDVKIQVEFNPAQVAGYRLIGYENRMLATEDFNDDKKDAGEIGAGHTVTALYEIVPTGKEVGTPAADPLKYQQPLNPPPRSAGEGLGEGSSESREYGGGYGGRGVGGLAKAPSNELLTLKLRYKLPDADKSTKLEFPITDKGGSFADATDDFQFAAAVASFGMLLRHSEYQGETSFDAVSEIAQSAINDDPHNYRAEFLELVRIAKQLTTNRHESHERK